MKTKMLLAYGVIGTPLFVAKFLVENVTCAGYDSLRHPVGSLALGDFVRRRPPTSSLWTI